MAGEPIKTVTVPLDINGLRIYKKQNPEKFYHKFGDIDLDNLPADFNINVQRMKTTASHPKTPLLDFQATKALTPDEIAREIARLQGMLPAQPVAPVVEEKKEEVIENVDGGTTLEDNKVE